MYHAPISLPPQEEALAEAEARLKDRLRRAMFAVAFLVFGLFGMAAFVDISGAVVGSGEIKVDSNVKKVAHPTGGVVSEILVRNGDKVRAGQPMINLDTRVSGVSASMSRQGVVQLLAQQARLEAEVSGRESINFPATLTAQSDPVARAAMDDERRQFALQLGERAATHAQLSERIGQLDQQINGYERQLLAIRQQEALIGPELEGLRALWEKKLVTITRLNQLERTAVDLRGSAGSLQANIAQARARITETREQLIQVTQTARRDAGRQLGEVTARLNDQQIRDVSADEANTRAVIRAPADGIVDKLTLSTIGGTVQPFEPIAEIVPIGEMMVVETPISISDIDRVFVGQAARIHFSAFNAQTTPEIPGKVSWVSAEKTVDEHSGMSYYKVRVAIDRKALAEAHVPKLVSGMPAETYIQTGARSMLSYLTKPLRDQMGRAFRHD
jgi:HlyD family type I secretion membrane fusion protein